MVNKYYQKKGCKSKRLEPEILKMLKQNIRKKEIADKLNLSRETVQKVVKTNGLCIDDRKVEGKRKQKAARNEKIVGLILQGYSHVAIAKRFRITEARVQQIGKLYNLSSKIEKKKIDAQITEYVKQDIKSGLTYKEILNKYGNAIPANCLVILAQKRKAEMEERNANVVREFKEGKTAFELSRKYNIEVNYIYHLCVKQGVRRYPQMQDRHIGILSEKESILKLIIRLHDEGKLSFADIADLLNKEKYRTISGRKFSVPNTVAKYKIAKKHNIQ